VCGRKGKKREAVVVPAYLAGARSGTMARTGDFFQIEKSTEDWNSGASWLEGRPKVKKSGTMGRLQSGGGKGKNRTV